MVPADTARGQRPFQPEKEKVLTNSRLELRSAADNPQLVSLVE